jgi:hypothetical protein
LGFHYIPFDRHEPNRTVGLGYSVIVHALFCRLVVEVSLLTRKVHVNI